MKIKIVFDNKIINNKFLIGWGFSCLVDNRILFDTGEDPKSLFDNMKMMGINIPDIEGVVISHDHWDHTGGLWEILKKRKQLTVYACPNFSMEFKKRVKSLKGKLVMEDKFVKLSPQETDSPSTKKDIFVTGEIAGEYKGKYMPEQALIARTENGITVITGCAHPGIVKIVEKVRKKFPKEKLYLIFGGFHLTNKNEKSIENIIKSFKKMKVEKVGPTHCSGKIAEKIFRKKYKNNFISVKAGRIFNI